jgi:hypothetical protein
MNKKLQLKVRILTLQLGIASPQVVHDVGGDEVVREP